jgi:hypothetical protein
MKMKKNEFVISWCIVECKLITFSLCNRCVKFAKNGRRARGAAIFSQETL